MHPAGLRLRAPRLRLRAPRLMLRSELAVLSALGLVPGLALAAILWSTQPAAGRSGPRLPWTGSAARLSGRARVLVASVLLHGHRHGAERRSGTEDDGRRARGR